MRRRGCDSCAGRPVPHPSGTTTLCFGCAEELLEPLGPPPSAEPRVAICEEDGETCVVGPTVTPDPAPAPEAG